MLRHTLPAAILVAVALSSAPSTGAADGLPGGPFVLGAHFFETVTPDTRYEWSESDHGFVLNWPIPYSVWSTDAGPGEPRLRAEIIPEFQLPLHRERPRRKGGPVFRAGGWLRFHMWDRSGWGGYLDGGYVVGHDGHGPAVGLGIALGQWNLGMLGISARYGRVGGASRVDVGLDFRWWLDELLD